MINARFITLALLLWSMTLYPQQSATLQGSLFKLGSNEPVSKASVELRDADAAGAPPYTTTSDQDGKFSFRAIPPGHYRLNATRTGFVATVYGRRFASGPGEILTLAAGQVLPAIQITMTPAGVISGHIYNQKGEPVANVSVGAGRITFQAGSKGMQSVGAALTNDLGEYRIFDVPPGQYYITALPTNGTYPRFVYGPDRFNDVYARLRYDIEPAPASAPVPVSVTYPDKTDPFAGAAIDVRPGADIRNMNIVVGDLQHTTHVKATFVPSESGQPVRLTLFSLVSLTGNANRGANAAPGSFLTTPTFDMGFVPPGPYMMVGDGPEGAGRYLFEIKDEDSLDLSVKLQPGFAVPGRIVVEGVGAADANLPGLQVELRLDIPINTPTSTTTAAPNPDGTFTLQKVLPGTYLVGLPALQYQRQQPLRLAPALQNAYVKAIRLGSEDGINGKLHLDASLREPIEIVIGTNAATLDGLVVPSQTGQVASAVTVALIPDGRSRPETFRSTTSNKDGRFHVDRISPGNYKVFAWEYLEGNSWRVPEFLAGDENRGVPVRFVEGGREMIDVPLIPAKQ